MWKIGNSSGLKMYIGSYAGNGASQNGWSISLPYTPKTFIMSFYGTCTDGNTKAYGSIICGSTYGKANGGAIVVGSDGVGMFALPATFSGTTVEMSTLLMTTYPSNVSTSIKNNWYDFLNSSGFTYEYILFY